MRGLGVAVVVVGLVAAACSGNDGGSGASTATSAPGTTFAAVNETIAPTPSTTPQEPLLASAASRSLLPTAGGDRTYLADAPGWVEPVDPNDIGVFVPAFDQGSVDVGNGESDAAWVHDDIRATALVLQKGEDQVIMITADLYMLFAFDQDEIERRLRAQLPDEFADANVIISATHNHHGPDSAFSINDDWYSMAADEMVGAVMDAIEPGLLPARLVAAAGDHRFGQSDQRDPLIVDPRLNVLQVIDDSGTGDAIATVVQWASHPETTLGWDPPGDISAECAQKGWAADDCSAEGRYLTADYPGVLRDRLQAQFGGEVLYFNGALGNQIGPGRADVWQIDDAHPIGDGVTAPAGAAPVEGAKDLRDRNLARTAAIGSALADRVLELLPGSAVELDAIEWRREEFYTRLTNIGFRVLLADGDLGWQVPKAYNCTAKPFTDETCTEDGGALVDDPLLTPLVESQIRKGDVFRTRITWLRLGDVGFLFLPGELPPELVIGLPDDFVANTTKYYEFPDLHATGEDYAIPGALLDLVPTSQTFTVGLGGDELGYWVPIGEYRLKCMDLELPPDTGYTCQRLYDEGLLVAPDAVDGPTCRRLTDTPPAAPTDAERALAAVCRYGQALGRELGEPEDHYEETNAAGWDLVDDTWEAATALLQG